MLRRRSESISSDFCCTKSSEEPEKWVHTIYYPFVAACPRCSVKGNFYKATAQKPPSGSIGGLNAIVIAALYDRVAQSSAGKARVLRVPGTGDADLVFLEGDDICVAEIKASPLVSYPLAVASDPIEDLDPATGQRRTLDHHESTATHLRRDSVCLYMPHVGKYIELGPKTGGNWPMDALSNYVSTAEGAAEIALAWSRLFQVYSDKSLRRGSNAWFLVNGCGKAPREYGGFSISDGKNMPGIDRTDDLKKGTYQVLKMGAAFKERPDKRVRAALVANVHAVIHDEAYVTDLADVVWTKDGPGDTHVISRDDKEWVIKSEGVFNLYDGIVCITDSRFRDPWLKRIADVNSLRTSKH
jgi:hypothetical protein